MKIKCRAKLRRELNCLRKSPSKQLFIHCRMNLSKEKCLYFLKEFLCGILVLYCSYLRLFKKLFYFTSQDWTNTMQG